MNIMGLFRLKLRVLVGVVSMAALFLPNSLVWAHSYEIVYGSSQNKNLQDANAANGKVDTPPANPNVAKSGNQTYPGPTEISKAYQKANEINSIWAAFETTKMETLRDYNDAILAGGDRDQLEGKEDKLLGPACMRDGGGVLTETVDRCRERFIRLEKPIVYKIQNSMYVNDTKEAKLRCTEFNQDGSCVKKESVVLDGRWECYSISQDGKSCLDSHGNVLDGQTDTQPRTTNVSLLPSYKDLQEFAKNRMNRKPPTQQDYTNWLKTLDQPDDPKAAEPNIDDFVMIEKIPRDPSNPGNGEYYTRIKTDANGNPVHDRVRYQIAVRAYLKDRGLASLPSAGPSSKPGPAPSTGPSSKPSASPSNAPQDGVARALREVREDEKNRTTVRIQKDYQDFANRTNPKQEDPNYNVYGRVRTKLVNSANQLNTEGSNQKTGITKKEQRDKVGDQNTNQDFDADLPLTPPRQTGNSVNTSVGYDPRNFSPEKLEKDVPVEAADGDTVTIDQIIGTPPPPDQ